MIVVLQKKKKLHETQGLKSQFHELNIYIYIIYIYLSLHIYIYIYIYIRGTFNKFTDFFVQAYKIVTDS